MENNSYGYYLSIRYTFSRKPGKQPEQRPVAEHSRYFRSLFTVLSLKDFHLLPCDTPWFSVFFLNHRVTQSNCTEAHRKKEYSHYSWITFLLFGNLIR